MGYIARLLPTFTVDSSYLDTTPIIGWDFVIRGFSVWATQQDDAMNLSHPAYSWIIRGRGTLRLPGPVFLGLPTDWGHLRKALPGRVEINSGEIGTRATFCALPRLAFPLDVGFGSGESPPADSVPPAARIAAIEVWHDDTVPCVQ
jgi:hypothetical protein